MNDSLTKIPLSTKITLEEFIEAHGGYWGGEHPEAPFLLWVYEVKNKDTRQGYWEWAYSSIEGK